MPGPNSAPNGDAGLVVGYPREQFVCDGKGYDKSRKHKCGDDECKMVTKRSVTRITGKTRR